MFYYVVNLSAIQYIYLFENILNGIIMYFMRNFNIQQNKIIDTVLKRIK